MLTETNSIIMYMGVLSVSCTMLRFAQLVEKKSYFLFKSMGILALLLLIIPLANRTCGVDYINYMNNYNETAKLGWTMYWQQYNGFPEPLYVLINFGAFYFGNQFQTVNVICSILSVFLFFGGIIRLRNYTNLGIACWCAGVQFYFFMFGLNRLALAVSVISWTYLYLLKKEKKKYFLGIAIAIGFHYSAIIMLPFYYILSKSVVNIDRKKFLRLIISIMVLLFLLKYLGPIVLQKIPFWSRYTIYFSKDITLSILNNEVFNFFIWFILIFLINKINVFFSGCELFAYMTLISLVIIFTSVFFPVHRMTYYFYPACGIMYGNIERLHIKNIRQNRWYIFIHMLLILMGLIWGIFILKYSQIWSQYLVPYQYAL